MKSVDEIIELWGYRLSKSLLGTDKDGTVVNRGDMRAVVDEIHSLRQRLAEAEAKVSGWTPIREFSHEGKPFLAYEDGAYYQAQIEYEEDDGRLIMATKCGQPVVQNPEPTHAMPLPTPPEGDKAV